MGNGPGITMKRRFIQLLTAILATGATPVFAAETLPPLFATATAPNRVYAGEAFPLVLNVFSSEVNLGKPIKISGLPSGDRMQLTPFEELPIERRTLAGKPYEIRRFRATACARLPGTLQVPLTLEGTIITIVQSFIFTRHEERPVGIPAQPLAVTVLELPVTGRPESFSGALGSGFAFAADAAPTDVAPGDLITLTMRLDGPLEFASVAPPHLTADPGFKVYPAKRLAPPAETKQRIVFEQVVIPMNADIRELGPVSFTYFDTRAEQYVTLRQGPFPLTFHAERQPEPAGYYPSNSVAVSSATAPAAPVEPLKDPPRRWRQRPAADQRPKWIGWAWHMAPLLLPGIALAFRSYRRAGASRIQPTTNRPARGGPT
jgi:hypothetical protein